MPFKFPLQPSSRTAASTPKSASSPAALAAFTECFERYQACLEYRDCQSSSSLNEKVENYVLDFELSARSVLKDDPMLSNLFRWIFVERRTQDQCASVLKLDAFTLASKAREVKSLVGSALLSRGLFPLNHYFEERTIQQFRSPAKLELLAA